jgi:Ras-related protein Rab-2A
MEELCYTFKYIIVGDYSVGKSCFLLRFLEDRFRTDHDVTIGVEFGAKMVYIGDTKIKLHVWDTAGSETFRSITRCYYSGSIGVLIVYDMTDRRSFTNALDWVEEMRQSVCENASIFLVGNKCDLPRAVSAEEISKKINGVRHFEVSAKTGENVEACFRSMTDEIYSKILKGDKTIVNSPGIKISRELLVCKKSGCCNNY